jgi:hypothetical protein
MSPAALRNLLLVASALLMAVCVGWGVHSYNEWIREGVRAEWRAAVAAEQLVQNRETLRRLERQKDADDAHAADLDRALADAASLRAAGDGLREQLAAFVAARRGAGGDRTAAGPGTGVPGGAALDLLADLLGRADSAAGELALYADRLHAAGALCERRYDALTP